MNENLKNDNIVPQRNKTTSQGSEKLNEIKLDNDENKTAAERRRRFSEVGSFHKTAETFSEVKEQNANQRNNKRKKEVSFRLELIYQFNKLITVYIYL